MSDVIGIPPHLVGPPYSCIFYLRQSGDPNGGTIFRDWSPVHTTCSVGGGTPQNSTAKHKFPPSSIYFPSITSYISTGTVPDLSSGPWAISASLITSGLSGGDYTAICGGGASYPNRWVFDVNASGATSSARVLTRSNTLVWHTSNFTITDNIPFNLTIINGGETATMYFMGSSIGSRAAFGIPTESSFNISHQSSYVTAMPAWYIDELAIWGGNSNAKIPTIDQIYSSLYPYPRRLIV